MKKEDEEFDRLVSIIRNETVDKSVVAKAADRVRWMMMCLNENDGRKQEANLYASRGDFRRLFEESSASLQQLSFLLTGDPERAHQCLVAGLEDCVKVNNVFRDWARNWAKRAIIQNAIRILQPHFVVTGLPSLAIVPAGSGPAISREKLPTIDIILSLPDFERFVFVMSVVEHYSDRESSLLLGCTIGEIFGARVRVYSEILRTQPSSSVRETFRVFSE